MSRNNEVNSMAFTPSALTPETITGIWDFWEEAFDEFDEVSFVRDVENNIMYIYLDKNEHMYITVGMDSNTTTVNGVDTTTFRNFRMQYWLKGEKYSSDTSSNSSSIAYIFYIRTKYGITWGFNFSSSSISIYGNYEFFYVPQPVPIWLGKFGNSSINNSNHTYGIFSPLHEKIEYMEENSKYLAYSLGDQKFIVTNAYSCLKDINSQHLFRVLGVPNSSYPLGKLLVGGKYLWWFGRYALEYDPDDTTGV